MVIYFDSSVLLSLLLNDSRYSKAAQLWEQSTLRVSSILLQAECLNVIRRTHRNAPKKFTKQWLLETESLLEQLLEECALRSIDTQIISVLQEEKNLAQCRTLDALHIATAKLFSFADREPLTIASFDIKMANVARSVGFEVLR